MSLLISLDDLERDRLIFEYLSGEFPTTLVDPNKVSEEIKSRPCGCFFTTSPRLAQEAAPLVKTILYISDPSEGYSSRGDNISGWRQNVSVFKSMDSVFVAASGLATTFSAAYRIPCRVQYPYAPKRDRGSSVYVLYNSFSNPVSWIQRSFPSESYSMLSADEDFGAAKLYIHVPEPGEQWHRNVVTAHTYGVPCLTYAQGCFSELCTTGDKMIPQGSGEKVWVANFKTALRDRDLNSKVVYEMSQRFHVMNELQQRIKKALQENGMHKNPPTFAEAQVKPDGLKRLQSRRVEQSSTFVQKVVRPPKGNDWNGINGYLNANDRVYLGLGGLGDAAITLSAAYDDPGSKVIFGANGGVREPIKQLADVLGVEILITGNFNGSSEGYSAWTSAVEHQSCKGTVHVPPDLNYGDWGSNPGTYLKRIPKGVPFVKNIGKLVNPRATKKVVGLCPRGSDHLSVWKQRYLNKDEYGRLVKKLLAEDATVIVFGSSEDLAYYGVYQDNNVLFMNSNFAVSHPAPKYPITMRHMLTAVHSCDSIISVDTWLKTYAALAGIPCKVIMNRYFGKSNAQYGDPSDNIFMDSSFWGFEVAPLEDVLA